MKFKSILNGYIIQATDNLEIYNIYTTLTKEFKKNDLKGIEGYLISLEETFYQDEDEISISEIIELVKEEWMGPGVKA